MRAYHQSPRDGRELLKNATKDEEEEDDGEEPQSDGHKQDPAKRGNCPMRPAGYQSPVEQPHKLEREDKMWTKSSVIVSRWVSLQPSKLVRRVWRNASIISFTVFTSRTLYCVVLLLSIKEGWFIRYAGIRFPLPHT